MATQSAVPPGPTDENPQNPVAQVVKPLNEIQEASKPSPPSVFVNSEPMREDQVQNAVKFLSHPKVRGSPVIYRRSFLEKKGLTKEEIDEAFQRVPDPPPSAQATNVNQEEQVRSTSNIQQPGPIQKMQPAAAAPTGIVSTAGTLARSQFHWYHALIAVGVLAVSGAGTAVVIKNAIIPRLKSWIWKIVQEEEEDDCVKKIDSRPSLAEEAITAAKVAAAAASDVAKASQELMISRNQEKKYFEEFMHMLDVQVQEMKSMSTAIHKLEGKSNYQNRTSVGDREDNRVSAAYPKLAYANGKSEYDTHSVRSTPRPVSMEPSVAPHPKSHMEIMTTVKRGERPPNIRPWEVGQLQNNSSHVLQTQWSGEGSSSKVQDNGVTYQFDGESNAPWWQRNNARITEIEDDDELKVGPYNGQTREQPVQRTWVPPQPPPVQMPEAAEAIRRPKPLVKKDQLAAAEQSASQSTDVTDELQRVTKISEMGTAEETNGGGSGLNSIETQEEHGVYE